MPSISSRLLLGALLILGSSLELHAQESGDDAGDDHTPVARESDEILVEDTLPYLPESNTIAAKLPLPLDETPASVSVVLAPLIEEQRGVVLGDALKNVSGVNVQTGNGTFDFFVLRGMDSISSAMIMTDGAREPESSFYQLYNIDRVEVLKGSSSFLYGASPLAGTVNLVRKQPLPGDFARVAVTGGSYGTIEGLVDWNTSNADESLSFRLNGLYRESDEYRDDKASEVGAVNPSLTWIPDDRSRLNINFEHVSGEYKPDAGLPLIGGTEVPDVPRQRSYQSPFDISDQEIDRFQVDYERQTGDNSTFRTKLYYRSLDWLSRGTLFAGVFPNATGSLDAFRFLAELDDKQEFFGGQFEYLLEGDTGSVSHNLLFGLEVTQLNDTFTFVPSFLPTIDIFDPVETAQEPLFPIPGQSLAADAETLNVAPYVIDQMMFGERVQLLIGARWDNIDFDEKVLDTSRDDSEVSPMVGLIFKASENISLYANGATAFAPPSTFGLEEDRVPEESTEFEFGLKGRFADGLDATIAIFDIERENIAIPDNTGITRQTGTQTARGIEIEVTAQLATRSRLLASYAYTDGELTEFTEIVQVSLFPPAFAVVDHAGNTPAFTPEHLLNIWFTQNWDNGFGFGAGTRYVSEQFISEDNRFEVDAYWTVDASAFYRRGDWRLGLFGKNLTGEEYLTRGFGNASVLPAPTASAFMTLEYIF